MARSKFHSNSIKFLLKIDDAPIGRLAARAAKGRQDAPQKRSHWSPKSAPEAPPEIAKRRPTGAPIGGPEAPQKSRQKSPRGVPEALPMLVQRRPRRAARDRQEASQRRPHWSLRSAPSRGLSRGVPEASILVAQRRPRSAAKGRQGAPILVAQRRPRSAAKGRQPGEALMRGLPTTKNNIYAAQPHRARGALACRCHVTHKTNVDSAFQTTMK